MRRLLAVLVGAAVLSPATTGGVASAEQPRPVVVVDDVVTGADGVAVFVLRREGPVGEPVTVDVSTQDGPRGQSWVDGPYWAYAQDEAAVASNAAGDYLPARQSVVLPRGVKHVEVPVRLTDGGRHFGGGEVFSLRVSSVVADVATPVAEATISRPLGPAEACHCFVSGIKVYGYVPFTACSACARQRGPRGLVPAERAPEGSRADCLSLAGRR